MKDIKPPAIFLMGPTAAGKTDLAVHLVQQYPCEIISVDSALIYRGMDIGTAKPDAELLRIAPHRLIDIIDPTESYSVASFCTDARKAMDEITAQGKVPLLVGGTMMYYRALFYGLSDLPAADEQLRERLEQQAQAIGWPGMHQKLMEVDPESAARIHANDPQRIQRALEVYELSGKSLSEHFNEQQRHDFSYKVSHIAIAPEQRSILHDRIQRRFMQMLDQGFVAEVEGLYGRGDLSPDLPSMRSVGYRQALKYLLGDYTYEEMVEKGIIATRQLAKRQLTWLRSEKQTQWFDAQDPDLLAKVSKNLEYSEMLK